MRKSIFYDKAKRSNKAKPDVSAWVKGVCTVHESKRFTAIFYWIALVACLAVICSAFADAGNISIDGYVQPGEWAGASFSTLFGSEQESGRGKRAFTRPSPPWKSGDYTGCRWKRPNFWNFL